MRPLFAVLCCSLIALSQQSGWSLLHLSDEDLLLSVSRGLRGISSTHRATSTPELTPQHSSTLSLLAGEERAAGIHQSSLTRGSSLSTHPYPHLESDRSLVDLRAESSNVHHEVAPPESSVSAPLGPQHVFAIPAPLSVKQRVALLSEAAGLLRLRTGRLVKIVSFSGVSITSELLRETYLYGRKRAFRLSESLWVIKHTRYHQTDFAHTQGRMTSAQLDRRMYVWKVSRSPEGHILQLIGSIDTGSLAKHLLDKRVTYGPAKPTNIRIIGQDSILDSSELTPSSGVE